jgi:hypothetical protein
MHRLFALLLLFPAASHAGDKAAFEPTANYLIRKVEGWTVLVHPKLAKDQPALLDKAIEHLGQQLHQLKRVVPAAAVSQLQAVKIWIEDFHPLHPCMCYHPDTGWLKGKHCNPDKARGVEIANPKNFLAWTKDQPYMVLHELAHAFHHQLLPDGYDNADVRKAYVRMKESKKYDEVLHINGSRRKHYALTNPMEYFAESSEAFFGTNDFFPFVRAELREFDPDMFDLLGRLWAVEKMS